MTSCDTAPPSSLPLLSDHSSTRLACVGPFLKVSEVGELLPREQGDQAPRADGRLESSLSMLAVLLGALCR